MSGILNLNHAGATIPVRIQSHRHRIRICQAIGRKPTCLFSFYRPGYWYLITEAERVLLMGKGIPASRSKHTSDMQECLR